MCISQNLREGLLLNDLEPHPMQPLEKPDYLQTVIDPEFGTTIRRITDSKPGDGTGLIGIVPMYSTIQAWNADESLMIVYDIQAKHILLDGRTYEIIDTLVDVVPDEIENIFWHFDDPDIFFYVDDTSGDFIRYHINTRFKDVITNFVDRTGCSSADSISCGSDVQMMSWDSDVIGFRCGVKSHWSYRISTDELVEFNIPGDSNIAPGAAPSGNLFYHDGKVYNASGEFERDFKLRYGRGHSCLGMNAAGEDTYFAVSYEISASPDSSQCLAEICVHGMSTGIEYPITGDSNGYSYPRGDLHISALAHKNPERGWVCASIVGYVTDGLYGQILLDQELIIARADQENIEVYRVAHHRSNEEDHGYFAEPHATISPSGTRILFGSDWNGSGFLDSYVAELPSYNPNNVNTVSLELKVLLSGAFEESDSLMRDDLRVANYIPLIEPYSGLDNFTHFGAGGGEEIDTSLFNQEGVNAIVDWLFVELRTADDPTVAVETKSVLLRRDGSVIDKDGSTNLKFLVDSGNYYIVVRHRNHLGIMTENSVALSSADTFIDFTNENTATFGINARKQFNSGLMALWSGDANSDGQIVFQGIENDPNEVFFTVLNDPNNTNDDALFILNGYMTEDIDLSGTTIFQGDNNDLNKIFFDILTHPDNISLSLNYIITEQIP